MNYSRSRNSTSTQPNDAIVRFVNVSKVYPSGHCALSAVNFELAQGEMAFLTGHSGAGKTTLLKLMMAIERPTNGQVFVHNTPLANISRRHIPKLRRHIGMVFQNPQLLPHRTVFANVALPLQINGHHPQDIKRRVHAALDKVGLLKKEQLYPAALSSGEQQRVGIARAVINRPNLLLADEPTGNLDHNLSTEIMQLLAAFNSVGVSVLIATHDLSLIASLPYRLITLKQGHLIRETTA